jgi:hypothetical protein
VLFLTALAKPRYGKDGIVRYHGKIDTRFVVIETPALKKSLNKARGTLELKSLIITWDFMREYVCKKLFSHIQDNWHEDEELQSSSS